MAAPLAPTHGTLVCRGTPVGKHWPMAYEEKGPTKVTRHIEIKGLKKHKLFCSVNEKSAYGDLNPALQTLESKLNRKNT